MPINYNNIFKKSISISGADVWPIIEGGKGIAISDASSSGAFARSGCVGTFSGVHAKLINDNGDVVPIKYTGRTMLERHNELIEYSIKAAISQAILASSASQGMGRIHMNILWEIGSAQRILHGVLKETKGMIHGITCGAGMPYKLASIASEYNIFYYPIVSSSRAFRALWRRSYSKFPTKFLGGIVYEDPWLAGGHNGISNSESPNSPQGPFNRVLEIRKFLNQVDLKDVPIIIAGGVWYLRDWSNWFNNELLGPIAFQFGTRPLLTKESPISDQWKERLLKIKKGDVFLNKFSPTGFYSSAVKNNFINNLCQRSSRQIEFSKEKNEKKNIAIKINNRSRRSMYISDKDLDLVNDWKEKGFDHPIQTPDMTLIFVEKEEFKRIRKDQVSCMGCLSHCKFSSWKDHDNNVTGSLPDPRSFCIQKTLQNIAYGNDVDSELMFAGHNVYKFSEDPFYKNGNIPYIKDLVERILMGN